MTGDGSSARDVRAPRSTVGWLLAAALVATWGLLRLVAFGEQILPLTFLLPMLVCVWTRSRAMLVAMAAAFAAMASVEMLVLMEPTGEVVAAYLATLFNIGLGGVVVLLVMRLRGRLEDSLRKTTAAKELIETQNEELATQNEELAQQAEELTEQGETLSQQAEELESQNEELLAQSEELDALNAELQTRSQLLTTLLEATRRGDDARSVLESICAASLKAMGDRAVLATVCSLEGPSLRVKAAAAVGGGYPDASALAFSSPAFEEFIVRDGRIASLDDAALRPDLGLLRRSGARPYGSALCAPFVLEGSPDQRGALCVYAERAMEWTDVQFELALWLAERCARALETLRLAEELRDSEERLNLALSAAGIAAWDYRLDSGDAVWNHEHFSMLGYEPGGLEPDPAAVLALVHPEDVAEAERVFVDALEGGGDAAGEFRVLLPSGELRWLVAVGHVVLDAAGSALRSYGVLLDVTQRTLSELVLREAESQKAAQEERARLARDLHDSITQALFAAALKAEALAYDERTPPASARAADEVRRLTRGAVAQMRSLLLELRSESLEDVPIRQLLRNVIEATEGRADVDIDLALRGDGLPPRELHPALYRITQEALNNVARHSKARRATVELEVEPGRVRLLVHDDGRGFEPSSEEHQGAAGAHLGLRSMHERAAEIGGELRLVSTPGDGTLVVLDWSADRVQEADAAPA